MLLAKIAGGKVRLLKSLPYFLVPRQGNSCFGPGICDANAGLDGESERMIDAKEWNEEEEKKEIYSALAGYIYPPRPSECSRGGRSAPSNPLWTWTALSLSKNNSQCRSPLFLVFLLDFLVYRFAYCCLRRPTHRLLLLLLHPFKKKETKTIKARKAQTPMFIVLPCLFASVYLGWADWAQIESHNSKAGSAMVFLFSELACMLCNARTEPLAHAHVYRVLTYYWS